MSPDDAPSPDSDAAQAAVTVDRPTLSFTEYQILERIAEGRTNAAIGHDLSLTEKAVSYRLRGLKRKFRARDRTHLVSLAYRGGVLPGYENPDTTDVGPSRTGPSSLGDVTPLDPADAMTASDQEIVAFLSAVGRVVREARERRGWTLAETSAPARWAPTSLSRGETGDRRLDLGRLVALCAGLRIDPVTVVEIAQNIAFPLGWPYTVLAAQDLPAHHGIHIGSQT